MRKAEVGEVQAAVKGHNEQGNGQIADLVEKKWDPVEVPTTYSSLVLAFPQTATLQSLDKQDRSHAQLIIIGAEGTFVYRSKYLMMLFVWQVD